MELKIFGRQSDLKIAFWTQIVRKAISGWRKGIRGRGKKRKEAKIVAEKTRQAALESGRTEKEAQEKLEAMYNKYRGNDYLSFNFANKTVQFTIEITIHLNILMFVCRNISSKVDYH